MTKQPAQSRLAGFIAPKGEAPRPTDQEQRPVPAPAPASAPPRAGLGVKSLTLRLRDDEYERLREFAFRNRTTHQDVLGEALRQYLDQHVSR